MTITAEGAGLTCSFLIQFLNKNAKKREEVSKGWLSMQLKC